MRASAPDVATLPNVSKDSASGQDVLDALVHLGGGSTGAFEKLAVQAGGSLLFADSLLRGLEALGHVQVMRDRALVARTWEVTGQYLAELVDGALLLVGCWTPSQRKMLAAVVEPIGGKIVEDDLGMVTRYVVSGLRAAAAEAVVEEAGIATVARDAGRSLVRALPPLSSVAEALHALPVPQPKRARRFDVSSSSWVRVPYVTAPGAYRLTSGFSTRDVFRGTRDVEEGTALLSTVQLSKHLEAARIGRPLIAHVADRNELLVPMGAELPGLYGRAAVLCSGRLPEKVSGERSVVYRDVPVDVAEHLQALLSN